MVEEICGTHKEHANNNLESTVSVIHPGGHNTWNCDICKTEVSTHVALVKHWREHHQAKIKEYRCTCGFKGKTALTVATHKRYCHGIAPQEKQHKYNYCTFSFNTEIG